MSNITFFISNKVQVIFNCPCNKSHHIVLLTKQNNCCFTDGTEFDILVVMFTFPRGFCCNLGYGMTESSPVLLIEAKESVAQGSAGYVVPNTLGKVNEYIVIPNKR